MKLKRRRLLAIMVSLPAIISGSLNAQAWIGNPAKTNDAMIEHVARRGRVSRVKRNSYWRVTLDAMTKVDRTNFVPADQKDAAYIDRPLPIGYEQTISDPFIVAVMTSLLKPQKSHHVLEIGTGSGYQAAILAELVSEVRTIEIVAPLAERATETLSKLGYQNVIVRAGDGYDGWPDEGLFDSVLVTAGAPYIPQPLIDQLRPGGRMVIPIGKAFWDEELMLITKSKRGHIRKKSLGPVMFVDFTGKIQRPRQR